MRQSRPVIVFISDSQLRTNIYFNYSLISEYKYYKIIIIIHTYNEIKKEQIFFFNHHSSYFMDNGRNNPTSTFKSTLESPRPFQCIFLRFDQSVPTAGVSSNQDQSFRCNLSICTIFSDFGADSNIHPVLHRDYIYCVNCNVD